MPGQAYVRFTLHYPVFFFIKCASTACPRDLHLYIVTPHYIKMDKTFWNYRILVLILSGKASF